MAIGNTSVDPNNLVEECFSISTAIQNSLTEAEDAKTILESKKTYLKHLRSKLWVMYKTGVKIVPGIEGKITDKAVDNAVECDPELYEATQEYNKALHEYNVHSDYATAIDAKKKSLEILTRFALGGWFSGLKIADVSSIEKFADGINEQEESTINEREALRSRRRGATKETI